MPTDPIIFAMGKWFWDKYGKNFADVLLNESKNK